jgi:hypothetical protein
MAKIQETAAWFQAGFNDTRTIKQAELRESIFAVQ